MYRFGEWLRRERLEHGWSQVELSEKTYGEVSQAAISVDGLQLVGHKP